MRQAGKLHIAFCAPHMPEHSKVDTNECSWTLKCAKRADSRGLLYLFRTIGNAVARICAEMDSARQLR